MTPIALTIAGRSVDAVEPLAPGLVLAQLDCVLEDLPPQTAKTGALGSCEIIEAIARRAAHFSFPLVVDPVMISKHGVPCSLKRPRRLWSGSCCLTLPW